MSKLPVRFEANARWRPSGDQRGHSLMLAFSVRRPIGLVLGSVSNPLTSRMKMSKPPGTLAVKAILSPRGDQDAALFNSPCCGNAARSAPSLLMIISSGAPDRYDTKAISLPSGDQAGERLIEPLPVIRLARAPS